MFVLKGLLRAESQEKIMIYLLLREAGYAQSIAKFFDLTLSSVQSQLNRMEEDGVIVATTVGRTRQFTFNSSYAFKNELRALLEKAVEAYPKKIVEELLMNRRRPRSKGKPVNYLDESEQM